MTPEEKHADAVAAAHEWRDEQRAQLTDAGKLPDECYELVWVDSGSGPGYTVPVLRPDRDKLS